jgi:hypothetical protein
VAENLHRQLLLVLERLLVHRENDVAGVDVHVRGMSLDGRHAKLLGGGTVVQVG